MSEATARVRTTARTIVGDLWTTFFVEPVSGTAIRSAGGATAVSTAAVGIAAFLVATVGVALAPRLSATPAGPGSAVLSNDTEPGLPVSVPEWFYPVFIGLLFASALVGYFGAVFAPRMLTVLAVVLLTCGTLGTAGTAWGFRDEHWLGWIGLPAVVIAPLVVIGLRRWPRPAPVVQLVALVLAALTVVVPAIALILVTMQPGLLGGLSVLTGLGEQTVFLLAFIVSPAAMLAGTGAVSFGLSFTAFLGRSIDHVTGSRVVPFIGVFVALLAWRLVVAARDLTDGDAGPTIVRTALVLVGVLGLTAWWAWATRGSDETSDEVDEGAALGSPLVILLHLGLLLAPGTMLVLGFAQASVLSSTSLSEASQRVSGWVVDGDRVLIYQVGIGSLLMLGAAVAARRKAGVVPAFLGVAGFVTVAAVLWGRFTPDSGWGVIDAASLALGGLTLVTVATVAAAVRWFRTRTLPDADTVLIAFVALVLGELLGHSTFLDDPFQPLLGFTGIGLVLFGVVWALLTVASNDDEHGTTAMGRALVLISYAVFTTALLAWTTSTGSASITITNDSTAGLGRQILGGALFAALLAVWVPTLYRRATPSPPE